MGLFSSTAQYESYHFGYLRRPSRHTVFPMCIKFFKVNPSFIILFQRVSFVSQRRSPTIAISVASQSLFGHFMLDLFKRHCTALGHLPNNCQSHQCRCSLIAFACRAFLDRLIPRRCIFLTKTCHRTSRLLSQQDQ